MVKPEVEKIKQATFSDGLGKQDTTKSIMIIQYWPFITSLLSFLINLAITLLRLLYFLFKNARKQAFYREQLVYF